MVCSGLQIWGLLLYLLQYYFFFRKKDLKKGSKIRRKCERKVNVRRRVRRKGVLMNRKAKI